MKSEVRSLMTEKRGRRVFLTIATLAILSVVGASTAQAGPPPPLTLSFVDPAGDQQGTIDVTSMDMSFKTNNGEYTIVLTSGAAQFLGQFRVNINLYNPDAPPQYSFFSRVCSSCDVFDTKTNKGIDFEYSTAAATLTLTGHDATLKHWKAGDRVATNSLGAGSGPLGNPPGVTLFRSSVNTDPIPGTFLTHEDVIGFDDRNGDVSSGVATIH